MTKPGCALRAAGRAPRYGFLGMAGLTRRQTDRTVRLRRKPVMNLLSDMAGPSARAGPPLPLRVPRMNTAAPPGFRPEKRTYHTD